MPEARREVALNKKQKISVFTGKRTDVKRNIFFPKHRIRLYWAPVPRNSSARPKCQKMEGEVTTVIGKLDCVAMPGEQAAMRFPVKGTEKLKPAMSVTLYKESPASYLAEEVCSAQMPWSCVSARHA